MFPTSVVGHLEVPDLSMSSAQKLLSAVQDLLVSVGAGDVSQVGDSVSFSAGMFRPRLWSSRDGLSIVDRGTVQVEPGSPGRISYNLPTLQLLVTASLSMPLIALPLLRYEGPPIAPVFLVLGWAWVVGGNSVYARMRFRRFLRRAVESVIQPAPAPESGAHPRPSSAQADSFWAGDDPA